jgi:hypothetical protein
MDTSNGRYFVIDKETGRRFCVEVVHGRNDAVDGDWTNGGIDQVKHRGSLSKDESIITPENGYKNIKTLAAGVSPSDYINKLLNG